jgi:hypothetical protein
VINNITLRSYLFEFCTAFFCELFFFLQPQILDTNAGLWVHLKQQQLIELIRQSKFDEALKFAQEELAHKGEENVQRSTN